MNYYIDFDSTLFDTYQFKQGIYDILTKNGIDKSYLDLYIKNNQRLFNIKEVFENITETKNIPIENFLKPLEELYSRSYEFVYEDVVDFLKYLKSKNHKLHILTWGEKELQKAKVMSSGIAEYFDEIIYAEQLKYTLDSIDYQNGIFIDDSIRDLKGLYNAKAKQVFRIKRTNGVNSQKELNIKEILEFNSLKELQNYIERQN